MNNLKCIIYKAHQIGGVNCWTGVWAVNTYRRNIHCNG